MKNSIKGLLMGLAITGATFAAPATADEIDAVKSKGELAIALTGAYPPFSLINDKNEVVGFDVSVGKEIARRIGVKAKI
ncbi:MAG: transporter substrate-binding domain-containing protein, partial [Alphaproteobacteria bacterium]|nr:transporter substrate-binding domain-containing protein [Alphaproteobacteria bacterium]